MSGRYNNIIEIPHKQSDRRPHMTIANRAAQFAPFAALVGYDEAVAETARQTEAKLILSDAAWDDLNAKLSYLRENLDSQPPITVTYFQPDDRKAGGTYLTITGSILKMSDYEQTITLTDGTAIFIGDVLSIESPLFAD